MVDIHLASFVQMFLEILHEWVFLCAAILSLAYMCASSSYQQCVSVCVRRKKEPSCLPSLVLCDTRAEATLPS